MCSVNCIVDIVASNEGLFEQEEILKKKNRIDVLILFHVLVYYDI